MNALVGFAAMEVLGTSSPEVLCNLTIHFRCYNGLCVNDTVKCDGYNDCLDGSDEDGCSAPVRTKLTPLEVAAIVLGCIIGTVIVCCLVGSIIDCFMHVYKYWCSCLHKAYQCPSEMIALRAQNNNPNDPTVLVVRAIPPSYSTIIVSCEPSSQVARSRESETQNGADSTGNGNAAIIATTNLLPPGSPVGLAQIETEQDQQQRPVNDSTTVTDELICTKEISTQTLSASRESVNLTSLSAQCQTVSPSMHPKSSVSCNLPLRLPPSYSSIFLNDHALQTSDLSQDHQVIDGDQSKDLFLNHAFYENSCMARVEVHAERTPTDQTELVDLSVPPTDQNQASGRDQDQYSDGFIFKNRFLNPP